MSYQHLELTQEGQIGIITISRPQSLNALNRELLGELRQVFQEIEQDSKLRTFIVTGKGEKAFVSGADIHELDNVTPVQAYEFICFGQEVFNYLEIMGKPSIAAINGYALGGGLELAMACDLRIASANARFGQLEIRLGNIPGWGGTQRLPRLVGSAKAKELIFTGKMIDSSEAKEIGLVNQVVSQDQLMSTAMAVAADIAAKAPIALKMAKTAINQGIETDLSAGLRIEAQGVAICFSTSDQKEGVRAFLEKRKPLFKGR
jgi:enoyl-CoA hydratase